MRHLQVFHLEYISFFLQESGVIRWLLQANDVFV